MTRVNGKPLQKLLLTLFAKMRHRVIRTGFMTSEIPNKTIINVLCQLRT